MIFLKVNNKQNFCIIVSLQVLNTFTYFNLIRNKCSKIFLGLFIFKI